MTLHQMIPRVTYANLRNGLSEEQIGSVKKTGTIIISGGVPKEVSNFTFNLLFLKLTVNFPSRRRCCGSNPYESTPQPILTLSEVSRIQLCLIQSPYNVIIIRFSPSKYPGFRNVQFQGPDSCPN